MAGRIYYETHIAPLLRMQGFFNEFALDFETAAGERLPVIANAVERRDADGALLFTALVVIKATDRRRYERQLVDSRSELQKGLATERETAELREQFIAVLGHDLRNPLAAISAGARILQRSGALQEHKQLRVLDMINTTVTRMSDLIDNVLDFARGRLGGGITLNRDANRPLEPVLEQVVDELRTASPRRVIETSFEITEPVNCDRTRIGQLASNLDRQRPHAWRAGPAGARGSKNRRRRVSSCGSRMPVNPFQQRRWKSCSSRSFAATFATAARASGSGCILPRRSRRRTAGGSTSPRRRMKPGSFSRCRSCRRHRDEHAANDAGLDQTEQNLA